MDLNGIELKVFDSLRVVERELKICRKKIAQSIKLNVPLNKYRWKFDS